MYVVLTKATILPNATKKIKYPDRVFKLGSITNPFMADISTQNNICRTNFYAIEENVCYLILNRSWLDKRIINSLFDK